MSIDFYQSLWKNVEKVHLEERAMKKIKGTYKTGAAAILALALILTSLSTYDIPQDSDAAEKVTEITRGEAQITEELTAKRTKFTKQYVLSDGSFLANSYSMPVHYKKGGSWKEINTTLVRSGKKNYRTSSTDLRITVAKKANKKAEVTMKRGSYKLSLALQGKKIKAKKVKIQNPEKKDQTDILNSNQVQYKNAYKNQTLTYEIYPEKIVKKIRKKEIRRKEAENQRKQRQAESKSKEKPHLFQNEKRKNQIYPFKNNCNGRQRSIHLQSKSDL